MNTEKTMLPLRKIRDGLGYTLEQVSDATGIKVPNLSMIERGMQGVSTDVAAKLVEFYGSDTITEMELLYPERFTEQRAA